MRCSAIRQTSVGDAEQLAVFCGQSTGTTVHVILDVNGYFE
jgi:hypothetical protein